MAINKGKTLKKEIGNRVRAFRNALGKSQKEMAKEFEIYQSTLTNIELGKTFPRSQYMQYWYENYQLDLNWLICGKGSMFLPGTISKHRLQHHSNETGEEMNELEELLKLMQIPDIRIIILARLAELKLIAKDQIEDFFQAEKEELKN